MYSMSAFRWELAAVPHDHLACAEGRDVLLVRMGFMYVEYIWKNRGRLLPSSSALQDLVSGLMLCDSSLRDLKLSRVTRPVS